MCKVYKVNNIIIHETIDEWQDWKLYSLVLNKQYTATINYNKFQSRLAMNYSVTPERGHLDIKTTHQGGLNSLTPGDDIWLVLKQHLSR